MRRISALGLAGALLCAAPAFAQQTSLRFFGHGVDMIDRVKIRLDDPALPADPGPPADVGATNFTLEFFVKALAADNVQGGSVSWWRTGSSATASWRRSRSCASWPTSSTCTS